MLQPLHTLPPPPASASLLHGSALANRSLPAFPTLPARKFKPLNRLLGIDDEGGADGGNGECRRDRWTSSARCQLQFAAPHLDEATVSLPHHTPLSDPVADGKAAYAASFPRSLSLEINDSPEGSAFVSKLGEIVQDLRRSSFVRKDSRAQLSSSRKGNPHVEKPKHDEENIETGIASLNIFANTPPIPWEADAKDVAAKMWLPKKGRNQKRSELSDHARKNRTSVNENTNPVRNDRNNEEHWLQEREEIWGKTSIGPAVHSNGDIPDDSIKPCEKEMINVGPDKKSIVLCSSDTAANDGGNTKPAWQQHGIEELPFEFKYSYSETPNVPILGYRERPYSPFGPIWTKRPWTGGKPPRHSTGEVPKFDSFNPPPRNKKGIKFVQDPGPYPKGQGPQPASSREEVLGEPLSKEEIVYMVEKCDREKRQINLGRDGLTHNMLDTIHCHWKRRRVCKIKCIGVPTVDMDNVCFHLEDKTGGRIIYKTGGVVYLFRGRNYNYKDRPKIPLMLWKPATPIYPKLIEDAPAGLTKEMANKLRRLGRKVEPIYRIGKNGAYLTLLEDVRNAFELDSLVRVDCRGSKPSDYKRIGGKLKDLVPCVLLSFEKEHILMWKGNSCTVENELDDFHTQKLVPEIELLNSKSSPRIPLAESEKCAADDTDEEMETTVLASLKEMYELQNKKEIERNGKLKDEHTDIDVDALWDHAITSGMAIELDEFGLDDELIFMKTNELAKTAPTGPRYTHRLLKKLQINVGLKEKSDDLRMYFSRSRYIDKPNKQVKKKRTYHLPTVDVPPMGGLPVDELAKLLAV